VKERVSFRKEIEMYHSGYRPPPSWAALLSAFAALVVCVVPARGQGNAPTARHTVPAVAVRGQHTPVNVDFTLPSGYTLDGFPKLRVINTKSRVVELLPVYLTTRAPAGQGHRTLHTKSYPPGTYLVRLEVSFRDRAGRPGMVPSALSTLTVPAR
jgi:hypothetical protein